MLLYMEISRIQNNTILIWNNSDDIAELTFFSGIGRAFTSTFRSFNPSNIGNNSFSGTYTEPAIININNPNYGKNPRDFATAYAVVGSTLGSGTAGDAYMRTLLGR
jgi:hypothetical protein